MHTPPNNSTIISEAREARLSCYPLPPSKYIVMGGIRPHLSSGRPRDKTSTRTQEGASRHIGSVSALSLTSAALLYLHLEVLNKFRDLDIELPNGIPSANTKESRDCVFDFCFDTFSFSCTVFEYLYAGKIRVSRKILHITSSSDGALECEQKYMFFQLLETDPRSDPYSCAL